MTASGWRYLAQRLDGEGAGEFIDIDLPLDGVNIESVLTGDNSIDASIEPEYRRLKAEDGRPLLLEWSTAIYAEHDGVIRGGGILVDSGFDGPNWSLDCVGFTGYLDDMPYVDSKFFVEADPLDIFRHIWTHVQSKPGGDLGLEIDNTKTDIKIGEELKQVEFDTQSGPISFEAGPYKLNWYSTHDLAQEARDLAAETPFDWREHHAWDGNRIKHWLEIGHPSLGKRRENLRFVLGENIFEAPSANRSGANYADEALVLGSGEGRKMKRGSARRNTKRLRRVAVVSEPSIRSLTRATKRAEAEVAWRNGSADLTSVVVTNHPSAPIGAVKPGDEIRVQGELGWIDIDAWYRVLSVGINPSDSDSMTLNLARAERLTS